MGWLVQVVNILKGYFSHSEAFGLPKGTVRASVFLILTGTVCLLAILGKAIPELLGVAWGSVVGFYYGQSTTKGNGPNPNGT